MAPGAGDEPSGPDSGENEDASLDSPKDSKFKKNRPTELTEIQKNLGKDPSQSQRMSFQSVVTNLVGANGVRLPPEKGTELEVVLQEYELRTQKYVLSLLEPTIRRATAYEENIKDLRNMVEAQKKALGDVTTLTAKAEQQAQVIEHFREELSHWDVQRRTHEAKVAEEMSLTKHELEGFRYNLEQKESIIRGLSRTSERINGEMGKVQEELTQCGVKYDEKHASHYRTITKKQNGVGL